MAQPIKVVINGFGRIGRTLMRLIAAQPDQFRVLHINDIAPLANCAYLFQYDSVFGPFAGTVSHDNTHLTINGQSIPFSQVSDISMLDLSDADIVFECTGHIKSRDDAERGLRANAKKVLISGPSDVADATVVLGANDHILVDQKIISNASCTTNALAPLLKVLDASFGLISGHMTTVHCYTGSQPTVDAPRGDLARSRAAALSMVPTTTSAGKLIGVVLPHLENRIEARAIRVPTASVSAIDLTVQTQNPVTTETANAVLEQASRDNNLIGWETAPLVSTDLRARPESIILSPMETSVSLGGTLRVFGWYDNEWGFSNRMLDMAKRMISSRLP
jgi:glyceraldehyde 3-phosphate dehydrogenase